MRRRRESHGFRTLKNRNTAGAAISNATAARMSGFARSGKAAMESGIAVAVAQSKAEGTAEGKEEVTGLPATYLSAFTLSENNIS